MYFGERLLLTDSPMVLDANPRPSGRWPRRKKEDAATNGGLEKKGGGKKSASEQSPVIQRGVQAPLTKFVMSWTKNELKRVSYPWKSSGKRPLHQRRILKK